MAAVILVTGGAGFIGSHIVDALVTAGTRCGCSTCVHPLPTRAPDYLTRGAELSEGDVRDPDAGRGRCPTA